MCSSTGELSTISRSRLLTGGISGSFVYGDKSEYDGRNLVNSSVNIGAPFIFISINYRLGFLRFPSGKEAVANNALNLGLLDQRMALQWVKDNIIEFNGDPSKIIIGGQEVGADSVAYHTLAYEGQNNGLFQGAIMQSGSALAATPIPPPTYENWQNEFSDIAQATNCNSPVHGDSFTCLQVKDIATLNAAVNQVYLNSTSGDPAQSFGPVVDGKFLTQNVSVAMAQQDFTSVPTLLGTTTNELVGVLPQNLGIGSDAAVIAFGHRSMPYTSAVTLQQLLAYYPASQYQNIGPPLAGSQWSRAVAIANDIRQFCPANYQASMISNAKALVWKYRWNAVIQSSPVLSFLGVPQASELNYLFPIKGENMTTQSPTDLALMSTFQSRIISFINYLDPNRIPAAERASVLWKAFSPMYQTQLVFQRNDTGGGLHNEVDPISAAACAFILAKNQEFLR